MNKLKFFCTIIICCIYTVLSAQKDTIVINTNYNQPPFNDEKALVIDKNKVKGTFYSIIQLTNYSKFQGIEFEVFVHSPITLQWESLGVSRLPGFDADAKFGNNFPKLHLYRYFAVLPKNGYENDYQYKVQVRLGRIDVDIFTKGDNIDVEPLPYHNAPNVYVFTKKLVPNGAKENLRLTNKTTVLTKEISIAVFGWDKKDYCWVKIGTLVTKKSVDVFEIKKKKDSFLRYKYFAIAASDGKKYDYQFNEDHDDWNIIIEDSIF